MLISNASLFLLICTSLVSSLPTKSPKPIRLRLKTIKASSNPYHKRSITLPLINDIDLSELAVEVNIGSPTQRFSLLFDTGSSDTWIPSSQCTLDTGCPDAMHRFKPDESSTFRDLQDKLNITYGIGSAQGRYFKDIMKLDSDESVEQTLALVDQTAGPLSKQDPMIDADQVLLDGIFGAGLPGGTMRHLHGGESYEPFILGLYSAGYIPEPVFSVVMTDLNSKTKDGGNVLLGSIHESSHEFIYTDVVQTSGTEESERWSVYLQGFQFQTATETKNFKFNVPTPFGVDTGSNFMYLPAPLAADLATSISNGTYRTEDEATGIYSLDCKYQESIQFIKIFLPSADLLPDAPHRDVYLNVPVKDLISKRQTDGQCVLLFLPSNDKYILGNMLLRKFITVFHYGSQPRIGFAPA